MKKSLFSFQNFRAGLGWILLIVGIFAYCTGYFFIENSLWKEIVIKIADVLVIGVVIGYLSNAAQFLGIFMEDLQNVVYGKVFLEKVKDIAPYWDNVSNALFENKFPKIHEDFLAAIKGYFPKEAVSYYNDYETHTKLRWKDKEKGIVEVVDKVTFELIASHDKKIKYSFKNWNRVDKNDEYQNVISDFKVNGKEPCVHKSEEEEINGEICSEHTVELQDYINYNISYTRTQVYNINVDYYIGFRAKYIVNNLRVYLVLPEDLEATFICRGTQKDFNDVNNDEHVIEKKYKGIVLPRQGYIFALSKKPSSKKAKKQAQKKIKTQAQKK